MGYPRLLLLELVLFESHMGRTFATFAEMKNERNELLRAPSSVGRRNSMRVDEGREG